MTVTSDQSRQTYLGNAGSSTSSFSVPFYIQSADQLTVTETDTSGVVRTLVNNTDYTITNTRAYVGWVVNLIDPIERTPLPLTSGSLTLQRVPSLTQDVDLRNQGAYFAEVQEDALDYLTIIAQWLRDQVSDLQASVTEVITLTTTQVVRFLGLSGSTSGTTTLTTDHVAGNGTVNFPAANGIETVVYKSALASTAAGQGDALIAVVAPVIGAATINQEQKNAQTLTMKDFPVNADGVTDDAANILAATTGIGYLIFPAGTYAINSNLTIPASCNIRMEPGAVFNVANGVTLTINGGLTAGQHQIFVLNATAVMKGQGLKNLEVVWFGAKPDGNILGSPYTYTTDNAPAFTAAIKVATAVWNASGAACSIHAPAGAYGFSSGLIIQNAMTIYGDGMWNTILFTSTSLNVPLISATQGAGGDPAMVFGMTLLGNQVGGNTGCFGLSVHLDAFIADHLWINGFYNGVVSYGGDNWFRCVIVEMCGNNGFVVNDGATTISDCVTYQNIWGINIQNGSASDNFATCITNTRSEDDYQGGMIIQSGHDVQVGNYSVCNNSSALYCTVAGIRVDGTSKCIQFNNVKLSNDGAPSQTAPGIWVLGGTDIEFTNCNAKNWLDGMKIDGGSVRVNGGYRGNNFRHGINANSFAGAVLTVTGGECSNNGQNIAGTTVNTGSMTASVNASNQLVVTAVLSGLGPLLQQEVRGVTTALPIGTYITGKISGAYGSTGTFSLSTTPGTVASQTVNSVVCGLTGRLNAVGYQRLIVTGGFVATQGGGGPQTYGVTIACDAATSLARVSESILAFNGSSSSGSVGTNQLASGANSANVTFTGILN